MSIHLNPETSRLKLRHLVARALAIAAFSSLIGWLT